MSARPQLALVDDKAPSWQPASGDATRRIFEHWVWMLGRSVRRCKLGPTRRAAINAALAMGYDEETLCLAVEGIAADPLDSARDDQMRDAMREIEWLLAREARIERWAEHGERLRLQAEQTPQHGPGPAEPSSVGPADPQAEAEALARREALRQLARQLRSGQGARHG